MKINYLGILFIVLNGSAIAADVIVDKQGISVNQAEVDTLLKQAPPKVQLELMRRKADFKEKLQELYLTKVISEDVKKTPLSTEEQAALDDTLKMFYLNVKIKQLSEQNLPNFEPLAAAEYKANKDKYVEPEQAAVQHILLDTRTKHSEKEAIKLAKNIIAQLKKGVDFATLALKYSDDPDVKANKGQLGFFPKGKMLKAFDDVAFKLKLNEVSEPLETKFGYHVLVKYDQKPSGIKSYEDVKQEIVAKIKDEYIQNRLSDFYTKTKVDNSMKIDEQALDTYIADKSKQLETQLKMPSAK